MIQIRLLGGAKKSFNTGIVKLDLEEARLEQLLQILQQKKPDDPPALDLDNIIVAVNGMDSSALDGAKTLVRSGDIVSIVPVIHGGAPGQNGEFLALAIPGDKTRDHVFLDSLRTRHPKLTVQGISSRFILGRSHLEKIIAISLESQRRGILLADRLETDMLLRFAATTQISAAINTVGIRAGHDFVIVAIGPKQFLNRLYRELDCMSGSVIPSNTNSEFVRRHFGISKKRLVTASSDTALEDILGELAAVLF